MNIDLAKAASHFAKVTKVENVNKEKTSYKAYMVRVPGHDGRMYLVRVYVDTYNKVVEDGAITSDTFKIVAGECFCDAGQLGLIPCKSRDTLTNAACYHIQSSLIAIARLEGQSLQFATSGETAQRLKNVAGKDENGKLKAKAFRYGRHYNEDEKRALIRAGINLYQTITRHEWAVSFPS
jgi:hypothetical protein